MLPKLLILSCALATSLASASASAAAADAQANTQVFTSRDAFLSATGATSATGALPDLGSQYSDFQVGSVTFHDLTGMGLVLGGADYSWFLPGFDWTTRNPGNDLAVTGMDNLLATFAAPVYSAGFDFVEPGANDPESPYAFGPGYDYVNSTFAVILLSGSTTVGAFAFNPPDNTLSFAGVWSDTAFDGLRIVETIGGAGDEYYGQFYSGSTVMTSPVPEPSTWGMMGAGLALVGFSVARKAR